jgi:hypothetical protein
MDLLNKITSSWHSDIQEVSACYEPDIFDFFRPIFPKIEFIPEMPHQQLVPPRKSARTAA